MQDLEDIARMTGCSGLQLLPRDMSPRQYFRGVFDGKPAVVMLYPEVSEKNLEELNVFIFLAEWLREQGLRAPQVYSKDEERGFAVLEDLGQVSFGEAMRQGGDKTELYTLGCDVLKVMKNSQIPSGLPEYKASRIYENRRQLLDYYVPIEKNKLYNNNDLNGFLNAFDEIEKKLPPCPQGFLHADFHLENLMWIPEEGGLSRCGIIDFQDALHGPLPYDLVNLLEDARADVSQDLQTALFDRYCEGMSAAEKQDFALWYRYLGTSFHCRVIGLFIKAAAEKGRDQYLVHIPRLQKYILKGLEHPVMQPLKAFFIKEGIDFSPLGDMNGEKIRAFFTELNQAKE